MFAANALQASQLLEVGRSFFLSPPSRWHLQVPSQNCRSLQATRPTGVLPACSFRRMVLIPSCIEVAENLVMLGFRADWAASSVRLRTREPPKISRSRRSRFVRILASRPGMRLSWSTGDEVPIILTFVVLACSRSWQCDAGNFRILLVDDFAFLVSELFRSHLADC